MPGRWSFDTWIHGREPMPSVPPATGSTGNFDNAWVADKAPFLQYAKSEVIRRLRMLLGLGC